MSNIDIIKTEIDTDPLARGYAGMTDTQVAADMNSTSTGRTLPVPTLTSAEIYEAIDPTEFDNVQQAKKANVDRILGLGGDIFVGPSSKARAVMLDAFGAGTATRTALIAAAQRTVSRGEELGVGEVKAGHVGEARRLP